MGLAFYINSYYHFFVFANGLSLKDQHCKLCVYLYICTLSSAVDQCVIWKNLGHHTSLNKVMPFIVAEKLDSRVGSESQQKSANNNQNVIAGFKIFDKWKKEKETQDSASRIQCY